MKYKLQFLADDLLDDMRRVIEFYNVDTEFLTLSDMRYLLTAISVNRAYDDTHPTFAEYGRERVLPYDAREYCFYYVNGANDDHVNTLLKNLIPELKK